MLLPPTRVVFPYQGGGALLYPWCTFAFVGRKLEKHLTLLCLLVFVLVLCFSCSFCFCLRYCGGPGPELEYKQCPLNGVCATTSPVREKRSFPIDPRRFIRLSSSSSTPFHHRHRVHHHHSHASSSAKMDFRTLCHFSFALVK